MNLSSARPWSFPVLAVLGLVLGLVLPAAEARADYFYTVTPCRAYDSRPGKPDAPQIQEGEKRTITLTGRCGVPADASAVAGNVTVVGANGEGHLVVFPGPASENQPSPPVGTLPFRAVQTIPARANNVVIALAEDGSGTANIQPVMVPPGAHVGVIIDVTGYFRRPPIAQDDAATVVEDSGATTIDVRANDLNPAAVAFSINSVTQPANGTVVITNSGADLTYTPNPDYCNTPPGSPLDTFTYTLTPTGSTATVSMTVNCANDAPVLTAGGVLSYTEGDPPTAIDNTITVTDVDDTNLESATVQITGNYENGADVLSFVNTATITGSFNAATGTLTLTGTDTKANWQTALRNVLFNNTSSDPSTTARTVTWTINDGDVDSAPVTSTINFTSTNNAPVLTAGAVLNYTENDPPTAIDTTITVTDADSANLQSATVQITGNYENGADVLSFINTATITGVFTPATGTLALTGTDTKANWQTALRSVRYNNTSDDPSTLARTVTWIASDGTSPSAPVTSTINVTATADAPVLTAGGTLSYTENDPPTAIDTTITVTDGDSANLQSATVQITGNYQNGQDVLSFTNTATITGVFTAATGTLALTGTDTKANWQTALRSVRYDNTSENPSTLARTVTWIASDGGLSSTPVTSTINVAAASDAPVLTAGGTLNYTENDPATAIDTTITVNDVDSANLQSATVQITGNYQNGADVLSFTNTATITGIFTAATGTLALTGSDTLANWQTALRSVRYNNTSEDPTTPPRTVTWIASDGSASSSPVTSTVNVTAVPDAPVLTAGGTLSYTENAPPTAIDTTITVTDPDSANLQSATVQITGNYQNGQDVLSFTNTATITGVFTAATGTLALTGTDTKANWQTALRSVRYNNTSDNPSTLARTVTWIASDGGLSSTPVTSTINVTAAADAPVLTAGGTLNYTENAPATAIDTTITVTDPDSANLQSATVQITGNYQSGADLLSFTNTATITGVFNGATGTLTLTGSDTLANWQTALRSVRYSNASDNPSTLARTVTWIASDGSLSSAPVTSTINVTAVPDAPIVTAGGTLNYTENDPPTAIDTTITVLDPDSLNLQSATVDITGNYVNGEDVLSFTNTATITGSFNAATHTLTLTGTDTVANWQTALRGVRYANTSNNPSTSPRTVTWIASDGGLSSTPVTSTINVASAPDAPIVTAGGTLSYTENDPPTAIDTTITVVDNDSTDLQSATVQITGNYVNGQDILSFTNTGTITAVFTAATGTLTLTGTDTVANWQIALRSVRYNNTSENPSTAARTVTWIASDGGASSTPVTSTINVTAVPDAPVVIAGGTLNYTENDPATAIDTGLTVTDVDSANLQSATVQIMPPNYVNGQDILSFTNTATITGIFNAATGTLTLTGTDTKANWQTALRSVRYSNPSDNPSALPRTVTWIVSDGSVSSTPATSTINVIPVNDGPKLIASPRETFHTIGNTAFEFKPAQSMTPGVWVSGKLLDNFLPDPDGPAPFTFTLGTATAGAEVTINSADGSFSYVPPPGATGSDTFTVVVSDGAPPSVTRTVTINLVERVWYVRNNEAAGGDGESNHPYDTLAEAQTASGTNDFIFVYRGDGTNLNLTTGIVLKNGQRLFGEHVGLTVPVPVGFNGAPAAGNINLVPAVAGNLPLIGATTAGGAGVTATDAVPTEIAGVNVASASNAINWTTAAAFAGTNSTLTIRDSVVRGAAGKGVNISLQGTGALWLSFHDNSLTSTGTAFDSQETGTGALTITGFANNAVSAATGGAGININTAVFDAIPGGGFDQVSGGSTVVGASGDGVGGAGVQMTNVQGDLFFTDLDIFADNGAGLVVSGTGSGMTFGVSAGVAIVEAINGPAVSITSTALTLPLSSLKSTNSASTGVALNSVTGSFSAGSGSTITGSTGTGFQVGSSSATVSYAGTITTTAGKGVDLTSNTGTIGFTGVLTLSSGSSTAFNATGGGTVTATNTSSTLTSTTGTALNVASTTIGATGLKFRSISAGTPGTGPANGIVLNTTGNSGSLTVSGTGSAGSGGTIQKTTGHGISLTSTLSPSFNNMTISNAAGSGVNGDQVTNFTFTNGTINGSGTGGAADDSNITFNDSTSNANISGNVTITGNALSNSHYHGVDIQNYTGTVSQVNISNNTFTSDTSVANSLGSAIRLIGLGSASSAAQFTKATIANNTITNFPSGAGVVIQGGNAADVAGAPSGTMGTAGSGTDVIAVTSNLMNGGSGGVGNQPDRFVTALVNGRGQGNFDISNNGSVAAPITHIDGVVIELSAFGAATVTANISGNRIQANNAVASAGIGVGCDADSLTTTTDNANLTTTISGNVVSQTDGPGIYALARNSSCSHSTKILNNTVAAPATTSAARAGIRVDSGSASGNTTLCVEISGNTTNGSTNTSTATTSPGINLRKQGTVAATNSFGIEGLSPSPTGTPTVENYVNGINTSSSGTFGVGGTALLSGTSNFVSCVVP